MRHLADGLGTLIGQTEGVILTNDLPIRSELVTLYSSVGWTNYSEHPTALEQALRSSSFVVCARSDTGKSDTGKSDTGKSDTGKSDTGELLGLARTVSDDVSICYVQDILVRPGAHRQGVGRSLMEAVLTRYAHVMQQVLITDDGEAQQAFYRSLGFHNTRDLKNMATNCYYRTPGRVLS